MFKLIVSIFLFITITLHLTWLCKRHGRTISRTPSTSRSIKKSTKTAKSIKHHGKDQIEDSRSTVGKTGKEQNDNQQIQSNEPSDDTIKLKIKVKPKIVSEYDEKIKRHTGRTVPSVDKYDLHHNTIDILRGKLENDVEVLPEIDLNLIDATANFPFTNERQHQLESQRAKSEALVLNEFKTPESTPYNASEKSMSEKSISEKKTTDGSAKSQRNQQVEST